MLYCIGIYKVRSDIIPKNDIKKLSIEKQIELKNAAIKEFSSVPLIKASINKIIQDINMPRGTFYLYFDNIEQLYIYVVKDYFEDVISLFINLLKENEGNIFNTFPKLLDKVYTLGYTEENKNFFKNFFINANGKLSNNLMDTNKEKEKKLLFEEIKNNIDISNLNIDSEEDMHDIFSILIFMTVNTLVQLFVKEIDYEFIKKRYENKIRLIKKGIEKC